MANLQSIVINKICIWVKYSPIRKQKVISRLYLLSNGQKQTTVLFKIQFNIQIHSSLTKYSIKGYYPINLILNCSAGLSSSLGSIKRILQSIEGRKYSNWIKFLLFKKCRNTLMKDYL